MCLQAQLSALTAGKSADFKQPTQSAAEGPAYLQWRGTTYTVYGDRLKACISQASELNPSLEAAQASGSQAEQQAVLEKLVGAFNEAKGIVRHSIATSGGEALPFLHHPAGV